MINTKLSFLNEKDAVIFAERIDKYASDKSKKKINLVSYGISDGVRINEVVGLLKNQPFKINLFGIDYCEKYIAQSKHLLPHAKYLNFNLFNLDKNPTCQSLSGKIDFVDASFILHEIYSFDGHNDLIKISHRKGLAAVKKILSDSFNLLAPDGELVIKDGYLLDDKDERTTVAFSPLYQKAYRQFAAQYKAQQIPPLPKNKDTITISRQTLAIALDKITFFIDLRRRPVSQERIRREMKEQLCYFSKRDFKKILSEIGFETVFINVSNFDPYEVSHTANVRILSGNMELPKPYISIIAVKTDPLQ